MNHWMWGIPFLSYTVAPWPQNHEFWIQPALGNCQFNRTCSISLQSHSHDPLITNKPPTHSCCYLRTSIWPTWLEYVNTLSCRRIFSRGLVDVGFSRFFISINRILGLTTMVCAYSCRRTILWNGHQPSRSCLVLFTLSSCPMEIWW